MVTETTYSYARQSFRALWDEAISTREPIFITRRGAENVALISADELSSIMETVHLLRSPARRGRETKSGERHRRHLRSAHRHQVHHRGPGAPWMESRPDLYHLREPDEMRHRQVRSLQYRRILRVQTGSGLYPC